MYRILVLVFASLRKTFVLTAAAVCMYFFVSVSFFLHKYQIHLDVTVGMHFPVQKFSMAHMKVHFAIKRLL